MGYINVSRLHKRVNVTSLGIGRWKQRRFRKIENDYVVGFPTFRASDLIPTLVTHYRDSIQGEAG